ncbi:hypothetical protein M427DRAFT_135595 [Gonapodya prolifera JEL478]|uniref:Methyltransferase FkbM domain-containing protein n=1 Tax=Gonapodya prolifera (strain JEL478) TaxID=1344416 RepID=A0A139ADL6_GONPJ|nr:hypothetical protein M427DRAFT_135595 [Gonapodya prolifera JEL478]|eukprot:KXS14684.1 hypothetical protein M427DRAFT_135595 [Gonapodya prolifera JEL478]
MYLRTTALLSTDTFPRILLGIASVLLLVLVSRVGQTFFYRHALSCLVAPSTANSAVMACLNSVDADGCLAQYILQTRPADIAAAVDAAKQSGLAKHTSHAPTWPLPRHDGSLTRNGVPKVEKVGVAGRKFYFDLGLNIGDSVREFIRLHAHDQDEYIVIAFECNPRFRERLDDEARTWDYTYFDACVSDKFGTTEFYIDDPSHGSEWGLESWGSSLVTEGWNWTAVEVTLVDFSVMLKRWVTPEDHVVIKIDIEGAEYPLIRKMLIDGTFCLADDLVLEDHDWSRDAIGAKFDLYEAAKYVGESKECGVRFTKWT